jgi:multidrug efflux pump subunit AcrB
VAAFIPLLFITGDVGSFMRSMPWTVVMTLVASYVVAVTVIPLLCYPLWKNKPPKVQPEHESRLLDFYTGLVKRALRNRTVSLAVALTFFALSLAAIPYLGIQFFPKAELPFLMINVRLPRTASFQATAAVVGQVEGILAREPAVRDYTANIGNGSPRIYYNVVREQIQPNYAQFLVNLKDNLEISTEAFALRLRAKLRGIAGATVEPQVLEQGTAQLPAIEVRVLGDDQTTLARLAEQVRRQLQPVAGLVDLRDNLGIKSPELHLDLDKDKAGLLGIDSYNFSRTVYMAVNGEQATTLRLGDDDIPVMVRLDRNMFQETSDLYRLYLPASDRTTVPLAEVASLKSEEEFTVIWRRAGHRFVAIQAGVSGRLPSDAQEEARRRLAGFELPEGYSLEVGGENEERDEAFSTLGQSLALVMVLIYAILAVQFNSFVQPFVIVFTIPFGVVGAVLGLWLTGNPFGFMAFLGIVSLTGIVINDSILLVDYANYVQRVEGKGMYEALLLAGRRRFGPVMMTSTSTIVGLIPLGIWGGSLWSPLANALIFGDLFSTVLILLILPVIYATLVGHKEKSRQYRVLPSLWQRLFRNEPVYPYTGPAARTR